MEKLKTGEFYGVSGSSKKLGGIILTDTEYTHDRVDWHYHENAYFTFILNGKVIEGNKKETYECVPGTLLFHNWQEAHYNIKPAGYTRGFHIELEQGWVKKYPELLKSTKGAMNIRDTELKLLAYQIFSESKINDDNINLAIESTLIQLLTRMNYSVDNTNSTNNGWVKKLAKMLHEPSCQQFSLTALANELGIHPVHLSRDFPKHFHCNLGTYIRKVRVLQALQLMSTKHRSLSDISYECGFSDQSHFIRSFKAIMRVTPLEYKKLLQ